MAVAASTSAMALSASPADTPPAQVLARAIIQTATLVPAGSSAESYEGQLAATIDRSGQICPVVRNAIAIALGQGVPVGAKTALDALRRSFDRCGTGTGAVGGLGGAALAAGPGFSVTGGGSDYRQ